MVTSCYILIKYYLPWYLFFLLIFGCGRNYVRQIQSLERSFFQQEYDVAFAELKRLSSASYSKDYLLYLLEAGIIYHTAGNYKKSNKFLTQAYKKSQANTTSISQEILAFIINDYHKDFHCENFELVLIQFYIALNHVLLHEFREAKIILRKLNYNLKEMKYLSPGYKQNLLARYLDILISENLGLFNDARVQYKNIMNFSPKSWFIQDERYVMAIKENDARDIKKYARNISSSWLAYDLQMKPRKYHPHMGELVIVHEAGTTAIKNSRGPLLDDPSMSTALHVAVYSTLMGRGLDITAATVISTLGFAENPIPIYQFRNNQTQWNVNIFLNGDHQVKSMLTLLDYSETAIHHFNDNYHTLVNKIVASLATKLVANLALSYSVMGVLNETNPGLGTIIGLVMSTIMGSASSVTIRPDLRCWRLLPSYFEIKRLFLEPGVYTLNITPSSSVHLMNTTKYPRTIEIKSKKIVFLNFRSF